MGEKLKVRESKVVIETLRAIPYKNNLVYIRRIPKLHLFEWIIVFGGEVYTSHLVMKPPKGKKSLNKKELDAAITLVLMGAESTIDTLLGETVSGAEEERAKVLEGLIEMN